MGCRRTTFHDNTESNLDSPSTCRLNVEPMDLWIEHCVSEGQSAWFVAHPSWVTQSMETYPPAIVYSLPDLPYDYSSLEPWCDSETLSLHHDKHHRGYVDGANNALAQLALVDPANAPMACGLRADLAFNLGGHLLHSLFWESLSPDAHEPSGSMSEGLTSSFGSIERAKRLLTGACVGVQGSGWGIIAFDPASFQLIITTLAAIDVWEHAYYLSHRNDRRAWVTAAIDHLNWSMIANRLKLALSQAIPLPEEPSMLSIGATIAMPDSLSNGFLSTQPPIEQLQLHDH
jgi:superoxide dismutase, Fe-Mn family